MYTRHANLTNQWLLNVAFSMTKTLNNRSSPKQNSVSPSLQCYFENSTSINACFPLFHTSIFYKISTDSPNWDFVAFGLIKYNGFHISGNKTYETPYLMP